jgi:isopenicillin-N N-acyltransferase-like protein
MAVNTHISTETSPRERGLAFGAAQQAAVGATIDAYRRLFRDAVGLETPAVRSLGAGVREALREDPGTVAEIEGIAEGAGQDADELFALNGRTEILRAATGPECSVLAALPSAARDGSLVIAQNWDWHPDVRDSVIVWTVVQEDGSWFSTMTEAGLLGKMGLNSHGVGLCVTLLGTTRDSGVGGIPVHVVYRRVLAEATDLDSALALVSGVTVGASSSLTIGHDDGRGGRLATVEMSPGSAAVLRPDEHGCIAHTNHFLLPHPGQDLVVDEWPDTLGRVDALHRWIGKADGDVDVDSLMALLASHDDDPVALCRHDTDRENYVELDETLVSVVIEPGIPRFRVANGAPCVAPYEDVELPSVRTRTQV